MLQRGLDADLRLALAISSSPRAYALLLGSGVSRAAGVPTAWEVVADLSRRVAAMRGEHPADPVAWYAATYKRDPAYSDLVAELGGTPTERMKLLERYFVETPDGVPLEPTAGHRAIAELVRDGFVSVVVTTNFDHLLEAACRAVGVDPIVISSADDIAGSPPLAQNALTVVKPHGDYQDARIRNTPQELDELDDGMKALLDRIFSEYGLITCGWSGEWDTGLVRSLVENPSPHYGTYLVTRSEPGLALSSVIDARRAEVVRARDADTFFAGLLEKLQSLQQLSQGGVLSAAVAAATAKRYLPRPEEQVRLHDLLLAEVVASRSVTEALGMGGTLTTADARGRLEALEAGVGNVLAICAVLGYHGQETHGKLVGLAIERLARWPVAGGISFYVDGRKYPATLALYVAGTAACAAGNYASLAAFLRTPTEFGNDHASAATELAAASLDHDVMNGVRKAATGKTLNFHTPASDHVAEVTSAALHTLMLDQRSFELAFDRFEYFVALAFAMDSKRNFVPIGEFGWRGNVALMGGGVPATIATEIATQGTSWPPVKAGVFLADEVAPAQEIVKVNLERRSFW